MADTSKFRIIIIVCASLAGALLMAIIMIQIKKVGDDEDYLALNKVRPSQENTSIQGPASSSMRLAVSSKSAGSKTKSATSSNRKMSLLTPDQDPRVKKQRKIRTLMEKLNFSTRKPTNYDPIQEQTEYDSSYIKSLLYRTFSKKR